jgi:hypothetical protein
LAIAPDRHPVGAQLASVTILRMRLTPACGEGWRRLSLVFAVLIAIATFGWFIQQYNDSLFHLRAGCEQFLEYQKGDCTRRASGQSCYDHADKVFSICNADAWPSLYQRLPEWGLRVLYSFVISLFALYLIRLMGWIMAGFAKPAST